MPVNWERSVGAGSAMPSVACIWLALAKGSGFEGGVSTGTDPETGGQVGIGWGGVCAGVSMVAGDGTALIVGACISVGATGW